MDIDKLSTKLLYQLIDNMPTMAYYCDIHGEPLFVNSAYTKFTGLRAEDIGNFRWKGLKLVHPDDVLSVVTAWKTSIEGMEPYTTEYRLLHYSGEYRWVRSKAFYVKDEEGQAYAWFGTIEDIHEYKTKLLTAVDSMEKQLSEFKEAEKALRARLNEN